MSSFKQNELKLTVVKHESSKRSKKKRDLIYSYIIVARLINGKYEHILEHADNDRAISRGQT